jgi:hypothetical protein
MPRGRTLSVTFLCAPATSNPTPANVNKADYPVFSSPDPGAARIVFVGEALREAFDPRGLLRPRDILPISIKPLVFRLRVGRFHACSFRV